MSFFPELAGKGRSEYRMSKENRWVHIEKWLLDVAECYDSNHRRDLGKDKTS